MKRLILAAIVVSFTASACGANHAASLGRAPAGGSGADTVSPTGAASPALSPKASPTPQMSPSPTRFTYQAWFALHGKLFEAHRTETFNRGVGRLAVSGLLRGPSSSEAGAGLLSAIPVGTRLLGLIISNGVATVDLSGDFQTGGGSQQDVVMRIAQVVYTLTQFRTVAGVRFAIDGQTVTTLAGVPVQEPQTRRMYEGSLPAILVETPSIGQLASSPISVSGTADVFEATVSIVILDSTGKEIAHLFTTATCGTGCRGDYSAVVPYSVRSEQPGTVMVFESSAKDGSPINVVDIPVILTP
jgi:hypothetical protein